MNHKENSLNFFNKVAGKNYGNSPNLDNSIASMSDIKKNEKILDIGCGEGRFLRTLAAKNKEAFFYGIDLSPQMIKIAKQNMTINIDYFVGESEYLPFDSQSIDRIYCLNSFHHFQNPSKSFEEMKRILKNNGEIIIGDIWIPPLFREIVNLYLPFSKTGDVKMYSKKDIEKILLPFGMKLKYYKVVSPTLFVVKITLN